MSMNSSDQTRYKESLAHEIMGEFDRISKEFSSFQTASKLECIEGCGKCCFKPDIYCSPVELLPLALELLARGEAQEMYEKVLGKNNERCIFLNVDNEEKYVGKCSFYKNRPLVCRTFGVSARHDKDKKVEFSVCRPLKEKKALEYQSLLEKKFSLEDSTLPFIDVCKNRLSALDPLFYEEEFPINQALTMILEKVLLYSAYESML
jgi:Fe-S-cluster containining protein